MTNIVHVVKYRSAGGWTRHTYCGLAIDLSQKYRPISSPRLGDAILIDGERWCIKCEHNPILVLRGTEL